MAIAALDNLTKGASGQAMQCANLAAIELLLAGGAGRAPVQPGLAWLTHRHRPAGPVTVTGWVRRDSTGRTEIWRLGLSACSDHCLAGSGWGTFPDVYQDQFRTEEVVAGTAAGRVEQAFRDGVLPFAPDSAYGFPDDFNAADMLCAGDLTISGSRIPASYRFVFAVGMSIGTLVVLTLFYFAIGAPEREPAWFVVDTPSPT